MSRYFFQAHYHGVPRTDANNTRLASPELQLFRRRGVRAAPMGPRSAASAGSRSY
jgi:hypothetical protein